MNATDISSSLKMIEHLCPKPPEPPAPPAPPNPTLVELVEPLPRRRARGLFADLLSGRPELLLQDAQANPDAYDTDVVELLEQILLNKKDIENLTDEEHRKVDEATTEFFQATPKTSTPASSAGGRSPRIPDPPRGGVPVDGPVMDAFWWT